MFTPKPDKDGIRWYGRWAGNEWGNRECLWDCVVEVAEDRGLAGFHQCQRKRGYGPGGLYCKQHGRMAGREAGFYPTPAPEEAKE